MPSHFQLPSQTGANAHIDHRLWEAEGQSLAPRRDEEKLAKERLGPCHENPYRGTVGAARQARGQSPGIDEYLCEGCGACAHVCPADGITSYLRVPGHWMTAETRLGPLATAELHPGEEASGKLVSQVKTKARELTEASGVERLLVDGAPGIGCPVIASASNVNAAILVTEPSLSGLHDLERGLGVVAHFRIPAYIVINKADLSPELTGRIREFAEQNELPLLGEIPFDPAVTDAGEPVVLGDPSSPVSATLQAIAAEVERSIRAQT